MYIDMPLDLTRVEINSTSIAPYSAELVTARETIQSLESALEARQLECKSLRKDQEAWQHQLEVALKEETSATAAVKEQLTQAHRLLSQEIGHNRTLEQELDQARRRQALLEWKADGVGKQQHELTTQPPDCNNYSYNNDVVVQSLRKQIHSAQQETQQLRVRLDQAEGRITFVLEPEIQRQHETILDLLEERQRLRAELLELERSLML
jgi:chromosome segregation ATPase